MRTKGVLRTSRVQERARTAATPLHRRRRSLMPGNAAAPADDRGGDESAWVGAGDEVHTTTASVVADAIRCPLACSPSCRYTCPVWLPDAIDEALPEGAS